MQFSRVSHEIKRKLNDLNNADSLASRRALRDLLCPLASLSTGLREDIDSKENYNNGLFRLEDIEPNWREETVRLTYETPGKASIPERDLSPFLDTVDLEARMRKKAGYTKAVIGCEWDARGHKLRLAAGPLENLSQEKEIKSILNSCFKLSRAHKNLFNSEVVLDQVSNNKENGKKIMRYLVEGLFSWKYLCRLRDTPSLREHETWAPLVIEQGSSNSAREYEKYIDKIEEENVIRESNEDPALLDEDSLMELKVLKRSLDKVTYSGSIISYGGTTWLIDMHNREEVVEFDGVFSVFNNETLDYNLVVVESKNMAFGTTNAKSDLRDKLDKLSIQDLLTDNIQPVEKGAFAKLNFLN